MIRPLTWQRTALVAALLPALAACGSGRDALTYQERTMAEASNDAVGSLALRNVAVLPPQGSEDVLRAGTDARASITVVSEDDEEDRLVSVRTPAAQSVETVRAGGGGAVTLRVPPLGSTGDAVQLLLRGLTRDLRAGEWIELTLTFERNGSKEILVPVAALPTRERQEEKDEGGTEEGEDEHGGDAPVEDGKSADEGTQGDQQGDGHGGESGSQG